MNMKTPVSVLCLGGLLLGCSTFSDPEVQKVILAELDKLEAAGKLTAGQVKTAAEALAGNMDWKSVLLELGRTGVEVALALFGVKLWRGGVNDRKGAIPT